MSIVSKVDAYVKNLCNSSDYGGAKQTYEHLQIVRNHARKVGERLGADVEVVQLAALLHDSGKFKYGHENHHFTSAKIARDLLRKLDYDQEKTKLVERTILHHEATEKLKRKSDEEVILGYSDILFWHDGIFSKDYRLFI